MYLVKLKKAWLSKIVIGPKTDDDSIKLLSIDPDGQGVLNKGATVAPDDSIQGGDYYQVTLPKGQPASYDDGILTI